MHEAAMSRFFGEIRQVAYLVPDIEAAMTHWAGTLGVGPWYYNPRVPIRNYFYRGARYEAAQLGRARQRRRPADRAAADAQRRALDVPRLPARGPQRRAAHRLLDRRTSTPISSAPRRPASRSAWAARSARTGASCYFEDRAPAGSAYPGTVIELSEVAGPKGKLFDMIRAAAVDWDGKDPVRPFPDLSKL